ncbi:Large neutral amino acids transporter [Operophtera brumata]|uniref:Large neutral amino acids transporter n=1 Tax=Operophtera brumata TaxID=104452 RepID=A0A0L7L6F8_OPEBR|nr:Large neutral amino acids transporter [Operophtera brumata]
MLSISKMVGLVLRLQSYLNFMTEELRDPFVNLPRAIYVSLPMVTAIYLLANVSYLAVLGPIGVRATEAIAVVSTHLISL